MPEFMSRRGFVVGNDREEYLIHRGCVSGSLASVWSLDPSLAKVFFTARAARRFCRGGEMVFQFDESPDRYYLTNLAGQNG